MCLGARNRDWPKRKAEIRAGYLPIARGSWFRICQPMLATRADQWAMHVRLFTRVVFLLERDARDSLWTFLGKDTDAGISAETRRAR
jgi:hypothetical protein